MKEGGVIWGEGEMEIVDDGQKSGKLWASSVASRFVCSLLRAPRFVCFLHRIFKEGLRRLRLHPAACINKTAFPLFFACLAMMLPS